MAPQKPGKQATKGAKQIVEENAVTLNFYKRMGAIAMCTYALITLVFFYDSFTFGIIFLYLLTCACYIICYNILKSAAVAKLSETGQILDSGLDLNMEGGFSEELKDMIILSSGVPLLSLLHNYFWFLLLLAPVRGGFMLWKSVLGPWLTQGSPEPMEQDDKKQKKLERKMKRQNN